MNRIAKAMHCDEWHSKGEATRCKEMQSKGMAKLGDELLCNGKMNFKKWR